MNINIQLPDYKKILVTWHKIAQGNKIAQRNKITTLHQKWGLCPGPAMHCILLYEYPSPHSTRNMGIDCSSAHRHRDAHGIMAIYEATLIHLLTDNPIPPISSTSNGNLLRFTCKTSLKKDINQISLKITSLKITSVTNQLLYGFLKRKLGRKLSVKMLIMYILKFWFWLSLEYSKNIYEAFQNEQI